jgi:hypothetical protein
MIARDVKDGIMSGYSMHIRQLKPSDVSLWKIELGEAKIEDCVAVEGEDLGRCLAAVVHLPKTEYGLAAATIWTDETPIDGEPLFAASKVNFAYSIITMLKGMFPHLRQYSNQK